MAGKAIDVPCLAKARRGPGEPEQDLAPPDPRDGSIFRGDDVKRLPDRFARLAGGGAQ
jgi:hypothetical protein